MVYKMLSTTSHLSNQLMKFQLSSNSTLFYRLFVPTLWLGFFGAFFLAVFLSDKSDIGGLNTSNLKWELLAFVLTFVAVFKFTLWKLLRIDADMDYVYVTNFFRTVRYPLQDIEKIEVSRGFIYNYGILFLKGKGYFGQNLNFIASKPRVEKFIAAEPNIAVVILK